jgi:hypothetical protein
MLEAETYKFINLFYHNEDSRDIPQIYTNSRDDKIKKKNLTQYPGASAILGIYKLALLYGAINNYLDKGGAMTLTVAHFLYLS